MASAMTMRGAAFSGVLVMPVESLQSLIALALGFAVAGLLSSGYRAATSELPNFSMLNAGAKVSTVAAVPLLVFAAPFLIMRNTLMGRQQEARPFVFVFIATVLAGLWSLMSGIVLVQAAQAAGLF